MIRLTASCRNKANPRVLSAALPNDVLLQRKIFRITIKSAATDRDNLFGFLSHSLLQIKSFYISGAGAPAIYAVAALISPCAATLQPT